MTIKKRREDLILFIGLIIGVSAFVGGVFFVPKALPECELSELEGSSVYRNNLNMFSLTIPGTTEIEKGKCNESLLLGIVYTNNNKIRKIEVAIKNKIQDLDLIKQIEHDPDLLKELKLQEKVNISGYEAIHEIGSGLGNFEVYYISNSDNIVEIVRYFDEYSKDPVYDSIVQSFKSLR